MGLVALAQALRVNDLQLEEPLEVMLALDWVARLDEDAQRFVLLTDPACTPLAPLVERLLLPAVPATKNAWKNGLYRSTCLADVLPFQV